MPVSFGSLQSATRSVLKRTDYRTTVECELHTSSFIQSGRLDEIPGDYPLFSRIIRDLTDPTARTSEE